ncbi:hypothetical protein K491DRAFT_714639 [Lophiostoma macrostomum CBS 122681]|uniref:Uncharacterized protein n=1 Tax=Lophiostoma macrostomum CBS 122681 TaxID=1314788 RepID=A0A6A6TC92_9PLEO|nr:hypothetical protein K491DRAFT_714639 [Lophiostoma macrostomum CBS 122681]
MCKVIRFLFACYHTVKIRESKCGGTYAKSRRNGRSTACSADAYINIKLRHACGPCQQAEWDAKWKLKLSRAKLFQEKIAGQPGEKEVVELVGQLESEYSEAVWRVRSIFPPAAHEPVKKVQTAPIEKMKRSSPLGQEVKPEDVVLVLDDAEEAEEPDAFHLEPINYEHPLDNQDSSYLQEFFPGPETSQGIEDLAVCTEPGPWEGPDFVTWDKETDASSWTGLVAWGPDAEEASSSGVIGMSGLMAVDNNRQAQIDKVVELFWKFVNGEKPHNEQPQPTNGEHSYNRDLGELQSLFDDLHMTGNEDDKPASSGASSSQYVWTDGANDVASGGESPSPSPEAQSVRRANGKYAAMLASLSPLKVSDPPHYCKLYLEVVRQEARQKESRSAEPRELPNPVPLPKDGFWWKEFEVFMPN